MPSLMGGQPGGAQGHDFQWIRLRVACVNDGLKVDWCMIGIDPLSDGFVLLRQ